MTERKVETLRVKLRILSLFKCYCRLKTPRFAIAPGFRPQTVVPEEKKKKQDHKELVDSFLLKNKKKILFISLNKILFKYLNI